MGAKYSREKSTLSQVFNKSLAKHRDPNVSGAKLQESALNIANKLLDSNRGSSFHSQYSNLKNVSYGAFSTVYTATHNATGETVAVKIIPKSKSRWTTFWSSNCSRQQVLNEVANLKLIQQHENALILREVFEDEKSFYLVTDYYSGGELFEHIAKRRKEGFREREAAKIMRAIFKFLAFCHSVGLVHADLKPENIIFSSDSQKANIKIVDFGLSVFCRPYETRSNVFGTLRYCSPEMANSWCGQKTDIWSAGVILYFMLSGKAPFQYKNKEATLDLLRKNPRVTFCGERWEKVSRDAKDFIRLLLNANPDKRPTAKEALKHPWLNNNMDLSVDETTIFDPRFFDNLKMFCQNSKLKRIILLHMAKHIPSEHILEQVDIFHKLDLDKDGTIDIDELRLAIKQIQPCMNDEEISNLFTALDVNKSGQIDKTEFIAAMMSCLPPEFKEKLAESSFQELDKKRRGLIPRSSFKNMLLEDFNSGPTFDDTYSDLEREIENMDSDKDGNISLDEFLRSVRGENGSKSLLWAIKQSPEVSVCSLRNI